MHVNDIKDQEGRVIAFEVKKLLCGRERILQIASTIPGTLVTSEPKFLSWFREEVFGEFELEGVMFEAWEPFGDNDCYWIGPKLPRWVPQIDHVRRVFTRA